MDAFDDKLNQLLSNPEAMDQILKMAQSLMGGEGQQAAAAGQGSAVPEGAEQSGWQASAPGAPSGQTAFQTPGGGQTGSFSAFGASGGSQPAPEADPGFLSGLGSIDPKTIAALLPILRELGSGQNSNARQLLFALRPYLKPERQEKVERALQLARLFRVGKKFLLKGERHV